MFRPTPTRLLVLILIPTTLWYLTQLILHRNNFSNNYARFYPWISPAPLPVVSKNYNRNPTPGLPPYKDDDSEEEALILEDAKQLLLLQNNKTNASKHRHRSTRSIDNGKEVKEDNDLIPCDSMTPRSYIGQRGPYFVLYNYIRSSRVFRCNESITYTTHGDFRFLHNLIPLIERWRGPISIALYAPGKDFHVTLGVISYLRECSPASSLITKFVTFHLFFDQAHIPGNVRWKAPIYSHKKRHSINCNTATRKFGENGLAIQAGGQSYKSLKNLRYPVNVARNVAKLMSTTLYVLPSDIELYPSPNLIPRFLAMLQRQVKNVYGKLARKIQRKLYVLPIFELEANVSMKELPKDKVELVGLLDKKVAFIFHEFFCMYCHRIPRYTEWTKKHVTNELNVFHIGMRRGPYLHWEPIYIGTKFDPMYDERLSWEGKKDKMTQGYILCVLNYEFHILDNAFLIHRPAQLKKVKWEALPSASDIEIAKQDAYIEKTVLPELTKLYGSRLGCTI